MHVAAIILALTAVDQALPPQAYLEAETLLAELGYWTGPVGDVWDDESAYALVAFRKVEGLRPLTGNLREADLAALRSATRPQPWEGGVAHIEVDLARQVLFVVDADGTVARILPVSTGSGRRYRQDGRTHRAVTPVGRFVVERKLHGWHTSELGRLYDPMYFHGGVAIHGSPSVPAHPASHGCVRVPMFAARALGEATPVGTPVLVGKGGPPAVSAAGGRTAR